MAKKKSDTIVLSGGFAQAVRGWIPYVLPALAVSLAMAGTIIAIHRLHQHLVTDARFALPSREVGIKTQPVVQMTGARQTPGDSLLAVFRADMGQSVFTVPLDERRAALRGLPWIKEASISRVWPNQLRVNVEERTPVAFVHARASRGAAVEPMLIDAEGALFPLTNHKGALPVLTGIDTSQKPSDRAWRVRVMQRLLAELGEHGKRISEIDVRDPENLKVVYPAEHRALTLIIGSEQWKERLEKFLRYYPDIRRRMPKAVLLDLTLPDKIPARKFAEEDDGDKA
ncbi:MAG: FtsQ-type POTRA domain-containing protein [Bryobacteraceae bacterium]